MGRQVRRVPLDFTWPIDKTWTGFFLPDYLQGRKCDACEGGWSEHYHRLQERWYGNVPFDPAETGSTPFTVSTPAVRAFAERNAKSAPGYYGTSEAAIVREAQRLADLFNGSWRHHLSQDEVDILVAADCLRDFTHTFSRENGWQPRDPKPTVTAAEVNAWSLGPLNMGSSECYAVVTAILERQGLPVTCVTCDGHGEIELWSGQSAEAEAWEPVEPPTGDGWQLWETVSEGSPISPVFDSPEGLAGWMSSDSYHWGTSRPMQYEAALKFVAGDGWAPSMVFTPETGLIPGEQFVGDRP